MDIDVFISHHTKSSLHITEAICNSFETIGIRCWYAPRNTVGAYANSIVEAIKACKVFVLVLNKEASFSEDVLNEINLAVERMRRGEEISIIPFHVSTEEISDDAKYYIGRMHWIDAVNPPMVERINELTDKVVHILGKENIAKLKEKSESIDKLALQSTVILPNKDFVGRKKELEEIKKQLDNYGKIFVRGMGGIGKSEIAKMFCKKYRGDYSTIVFANYATNLKDMIISKEEIPIKNFERKTEQDGKMESDEAFFKRKLGTLKEITDEKTLIIVDNFDVEQDENLEEFIKGNYNVIFTTRNDFEYTGIPVISIEALENEEEQMQIFENNCKMRIENKEEIKEIIKTVYGHTLAIELIAKLMQNRRISPNQMLEILKNKGINPELQGNVNHAFQKASTIYGYINLLFNVASLDEDEIYVLMNLSLFPNSGVELTKFAELCEIEDISVIDGLIKKSWILHDWYTDNIALHPLITDVVRNECKPDLVKCNTLFENLISNIHADNAKTRLKYAAVFQSIYNKFPKIEIQYEKEFRAINYLFMDVEYYELADKLSNDLLELNRQYYTENSVEVAVCYYNIADSYLRKIDYDNAEKYFKKSVEILRKVDKDKITLGYTLKFYSFLLLKLERAKDAKQLLEECYEIYKEKLKPYEEEMGSIYYAFSKMHYQLEEYDKALEDAQKSYDILKALKGESSLEVTSPMQIIGLVYSKLGRYGEALEMLNKVLKTREKMFIKNHFNILGIYELIADVYLNKKDYKKAKKEFVKLKEILDTKIDNTHEWHKRIVKKIQLCDENEQ